MNSRSLAVAALLSWSANAAAGDFSLGYLSWNQKISGTVTTSDSRLDLKNDLDAKAHDRSLVLLSWDTGPGWWPDLAASYAHVDADGSRSFSSGSGPLGIILPGGGEITANAAADLHDLDLSLRYPLQLAENTRLWLGVTVKRVNGDVLVKDENDSEQSREDVDQTFPMAHLRLRSDIADWLQVEASGNYASAGDDRAYDYRLQLSTSPGAISLTAGWLSKAYRVNTASYQVDARLSGPVLGLGLTLR